MKDGTGHFGVTTADSPWFTPPGVQISLSLTRCTRYMLFWVLPSRGALCWPGACLCLH